MKSTAFDMAMMAYRQNDMEGAFRQFLPLAETGDADAMNMAANMFERGQGTHRDPGRAVFWWKKGGMPDRRTPAIRGSSAQISAKPRNTRLPRAGTSR